MRPALVAAISVLVAAAIGGEPPPGSLVNWSDVEESIQAAWPGTISLEHDPADDFVTITVPDGTTAADAAERACSTVKPIMHDAGSRALFAIYSRSGDILASWNRCQPVPPGGP